MSSIMRWRNGLMGLSSIAKAPVSHGVQNPMILRQSDASRCPGLQPLTPTLAAHRESREADIADCGRGRLIWAESRRLTRPSRMTSERHIAVLDGRRVQGGDGTVELDGNVNWKTAPRGALALAHNRPPYGSMIERQIDSPSPRPFGLVVWKALKRFSRAPGASPGPESRNSDEQVSRLGLFGRDQQFPRLFARLAHGLDGVEDQVEDDLLQFDPIAVNHR